VGLAYQALVRKKSVDFSSENVVPMRLVVIFQAHLGIGP
jgi:hypothetical protein